MNIRGSTFRSLPSWENVPDFSSRGEGLASHKHAFWACFPLALRITPATFGPRAFKGLPWAPPKEERRRFFPFVSHAQRFAAYIC
jgi:hypothetical protein